MVDEVAVLTGRAKVVWFGIGLVLVGLVLVYNVGLASLAHSPVLREHNLTDPLTTEVSSRAVVTSDVELLRWNTMPEFVSPDDVRVEGVAAGSGTLFMGIAPADAVAGYLDGIVHDEITEWDSMQDEIVEVVYTRNEGATDPAAPGTEGFWVASVSGSGVQALDWTIQSGKWALVIMNADGSSGVSADVRFGVATLSVLFPIGLASLVVGLVALISGGRMVTSLPSRPDETQRWTLRGRSVLPTSVEGRVAVLCSVLVFVPFVSGTVFGAPIFLFLGARKGDRGSAVGAALGRVDHRDRARPHRCLEYPWWVDASEREPVRVPAFSLATPRDNRGRATEDGCRRRCAGDERRPHDRTVRSDLPADLAVQRSDATGRSGWSRQRQLCQDSLGPLIQAKTAQP